MVLGPPYPSACPRLCLQDPTKQPVPPGKNRRFHVAVTSNDSKYVQWQMRVMYYWYKKRKVSSAAQLARSLPQRMGWMIPKIPSVSLCGFRAPHWAAYPVWSGRISSHALKSTRDLVFVSNLGSPFNGGARIAVAPTSLRSFCVLGLDWRHPHSALCTLRSAVRRVIPIANALQYLPCSVPLMPSFHART